MKSLTPIKFIFFGLAKQNLLVKPYTNFYYTKSKIYNRNDNLNNRVNIGNGINIDNRINNKIS